MGHHQANNLASLAKAIFDETDAKIKRLREIIVAVAPAGSPNELTVRKMTSFEEAEQIYNPDLVA